ncbi:MAG: protein-L-isoaspartate(D-aspartate) O-methyltransferase [Saprospiraceae bacterium]
MFDSYRHKGLRQKLVQELRQKGIKDERILSAFNDIPRHYFIDKAFSDWAYKDVAFPIDADQTISQPYTVAIQTQLMDVQTGDKILEIGTGSGFQACVLAYLGAKVYTIERQKQLFDKSSEFLPKIGFNQVRLLYGDGYLGAPRFAPFDKIIVTAGASQLPQTLFDQLKDGGIMVIPHGNADILDMKKITKSADGNHKIETFGKFRFVPFVKGVQ